MGASGLNRLTDRANVRLCLPCGQAEGHATQDTALRYRFRDERMPGDENPERAFEEA